MLGWYLFITFHCRERAFVIVGEDDDGMAVIENPFWLVIEDMGMILNCHFAGFGVPKKCLKIEQ